MDRSVDITTALRRHVPAAIRDVSDCGALLDSSTLLRVGSIGLLEVELDGVRRLEWFRVARVERSREPGVPHVIGVEFLPVGIAGDGSLRGAIRSFTRAGPGSNLAASGKLSGNTGKTIPRENSRGTTSARTRRGFPRGAGDSDAPAPRDAAGSAVAQRPSARTSGERHSTTGDER